MNTRTTLAAVITVAAVMLALTSAIHADEKAESATAGTSTSTTQIAANPALLDPTLVAEKAPEAFRVDLETTKGDVVILVNRSWAPKGADRFYNLVKIGYYDNIAFYRVIKGFMAQCGFNGDPAVTAAWSREKLTDDPIVQANTRGMVTFAMGGPDSRTTQFFVNYADNSYLKDHGAFAPFGKVISGMDVMDSIYAGYGEGAPNGRGPSQGKIASAGNAYLEENFPKLDYIKRARIVEPSE